MVLTSAGNDEEGLRLVRMGAQDYLIKGRFDPPLLYRVITYTAERCRLLREVQDLRQREQREQELRALRELSRHAAEMALNKPLRMQEQAPERFAEAVALYEGFLDQALERRVYRTERGAFAGSLRAFADDLAKTQAGPKEVVDIHSTALQQKMAGAPEIRGQAYLEEARFVLIEAMGALVKSYRLQAVPGLAAALGPE